jgi:hypothetical protein
VPDPDPSPAIAAVGVPIEPDGPADADCSVADPLDGHGGSGGRPDLRCELPLDGRAGQLVDRLVWVIDRDDLPLVPRWWAEVGLIVAVSVGGSAVEVMPSLGAGTTVGIDLTSGSGVLRVGRTAYLNALRFRLFELLDDGVDERYLVRSLRDEVAGFLASDYVGGSRPIEDLAELVDRVLAAPALQTRIRAENRHFVGCSETELIDRLTGRRDPAGVPGPEAIEALAQWAAQDAWSIRTSQAVDDRQLDQWVAAGRQARQPAPRLRVIRTD